MTFPSSWHPLPSEEEMERSFTQWEREQQQPDRKGQMTPSEFLEFQKQFNPSAVVEAAWSECE